jgi:hypothetical protein
MVQLFLTVLGAVQRLLPFSKRHSPGDPCSAPASRRVQTPATVAALESWRSLLLDHPPPLLVPLDRCPPHCQTGERRGSVVSRGIERYSSNRCDPVFACVFGAKDLRLSGDCGSHVASFSEARPTFVSKTGKPPAHLLRAGREGGGETNSTGAQPDLFWATRFLQSSRITPTRDGEHDLVPRSDQRSILCLPNQWTLPGSVGLAPTATLVVGLSSMRYA